MSNLEWKSEKRLLTDLIPAPYNPRQLTEKQAQDLTNSLTKFNLADPIVINADNKIIGGHQRINILKTQGVTEVDVRVPQRLLTEEEEKELNLRLNKNLGEWNFDLLSSIDESLLKEIGFTDFDLGIAGFGEEENTKNGRLEYYHKEIECPFCHKKFKRKVNDV